MQKQVESKVSRSARFHSREVSWWLDYLPPCFDWHLEGDYELTWGEGCQKGSFHRLPVRGERPTVTVHQTQRCLMGVHLLHWQPTLHWGKENTRLLPDHHSLGKVQRAEWMVEKGRARRRREAVCVCERVREGRVNERSKGMESLLVLLSNFRFQEQVLCSECHTRLVPQGKSSTAEWNSLAKSIKIISIT